MGITLHLVDTKCSSSINMKFFVLASLCAAASAEAYYGGYGFGGLRTYSYGPARYGAYRGIYKREAEADAEAYYGNYGYSGLTGYGAGYGYGARAVAAAPVYGYTGYNTGYAGYGAGYRGLYKREADAEAYYGNYGNYGYSGLTGYGAGYGYGARAIAATPVYGYTGYSTGAYGYGY